MGSCVDMCGYVQLWVAMCSYGQLCGYVQLWLAMCSYGQLCGYVWLCVAMGGCVGMCGYVLLYVAMCGCVWLRVAKCRYVQPCVAMGWLFWQCVTRCEPVNGTSHYGHSCNGQLMASAISSRSLLKARKIRYMASRNEYSKKRLGEISTVAYNTSLENTSYRNRYCN